MSTTKANVYVTFSSCSHVFFTYSLRILHVHFTKHVRNIYSSICLCLLSYSRKINAYAQFFKGTHGNKTLTLSNLQMHLNSYVAEAFRKHCGKIQNGCMWKRGDIFFYHMTSNIPITLFSLYVTHVI